MFYDCRYSIEECVDAAMLAVDSAASRMQTSGVIFKIYRFLLSSVTNTTLETRSWKNLRNLKTESIDRYLNDDIIEAEKWSGGQSVKPMEFASAKSNLRVGRPNTLIKEFREYIHQLRYALRHKE
uniref:Uncharacterized protein n=1 Tax=Glossina pallidipes TaxID=7398 RepID=A0A1A9ZUT3_GLOPL